MSFSLFMNSPVTLITKNMRHNENLKINNVV